MVCGLDFHRTSSRLCQDDEMGLWKSVNWENRWGAVDQQSNVIDAMVQSRRNGNAAVTLVHDYASDSSSCSRMHLLPS